MPAESLLALMDRWLVVQAEACGVTGTRPTGTAWNARTLAQVAPGGWVRIIRPPADVVPSRTLYAARKQVGTRYGFLTMASIAISILPPRWLRWPVQFRDDSTWICSALGAEALRYGGWWHTWPDVYTPWPSEVLHALLADGGVEVDVETARPGDVGFAHSSGFIGKAIRFAERKTPDSIVNHMFVLDRLRPPPQLALAA